MKKLFMGIFVLCMSVMNLSTVSASYTPSAELSTKVDVVETMLMDMLVQSSEGVAMGFVDALESYEDMFISTNNERNLYIVQALMFDIKPMVYCLFNGGTYLTGVRECEEIDMDTCMLVGGTFNECGSACRNEPDAAICTLQCVQYCNMGAEDDMINADQEVSGPSDDIVLDTNDMTDMSSESQERLIDSMMVDCTGVGPQKCLQVTRVDNQSDLNTVLFYDTINGLDYKEGFRYRVNVKVTTLDPMTVPADASSMRYDLINIISETVDGDVCSHYYDGCNNCIVSMNDMGEYVSACTRMVCALQNPMECTMFKNTFISPNASTSINDTCTGNNPTGVNCFNG